MGTTNITQALLKVTEGGFVSKIFDLISLRTEKWKTGWTGWTAQFLQEEQILITAKKIVFNSKFVSCKV